MMIDPKIEAAARKLWPKADLTLFPAGVGHVGYTDTDPKGFKLFVREEGVTVAQVTGASDDQILEELERRRAP